MEIEREAERRVRQEDINNREINSNEKKSVLARYR